MRLSIRRSRRHLVPGIGLLLVTAVALGATACPASARDDMPGGPTPPRLGFVDGDVSFWRPGAEDWASAQVNTPLAAGDSLYAGDGGNFELQAGPRAFVRGGATTELGLESLAPDYMQLKVTGGRTVLDLKQLARGQTFEVDTPNAAFTVDRPGYYRIDVDENTSAFVARRGGAATVVPENGETVDLGENQRVVFATDTDRAIVTPAADPDAWDQWNYARTAQLGEAPRSAQYVPRDVAGVDDLDRYGDWRDVPEHGHLWVPRDTPPDWAPYSTGRWVYDPQYEWSWVDDAPWGWAPYHYGRWVNTGGYWGWAPGPIVVTPVYAPALVAFFGTPGIGVSVGVGLPFLSWCALGFGEPVIPWWGGSRFAGRPYWGGWGGPRYVNNVIVNNTTIINPRNIEHFRNMDVRNAMMGVDRGQFGRGRGQHVRIDPQHTFQPVRGQLGVRPVAASLVPSERRGRRPPDALRARQVVATRPPEDAHQRLRSRGLEPSAAGAAAPPPPRIANPRRGPHSRPGVAGGGEGRPPSEPIPGAPGATRPTVVHGGNPQQPGHGARFRDQAPPTPPPHGERARPDRSFKRSQAAAPPSLPLHTTPAPPLPNGERARPGRPSSRPEAVAPPSPPRDQQRGRTHIGDTSPPPAPRSMPRQERQSPRRAPARVEPARPERMMQAPRPQREAAPRPRGNPPPQRSTPAMDRRGGPPPHQPSAPPKPQEQRPRREQHPPRHGEETNR